MMPSEAKLKILSRAITYLFTTEHVLQTIIFFTEIYSKIFILKILKPPPPPPPTSPDNRMVAPNRKDTYMRNCSNYCRLHLSDYITKIKKFKISLNQK